MENVVHMGLRPRYVDPKYLAERRRHEKYGPKPPKKADSTAPNNGATSSSASQMRPLASGEMWGPTEHEVIEGWMSAPRPSADVSALADMLTLANVLALANAPVSMSVSALASVSAAPLEPVTAPRAMKSPALVLIPATPQTAVEAATYMAIQLVANQANAKSGLSGGKMMEGEPATDTEEVAATLTLADTSPLAKAECEGDVETVKTSQVKVLLVKH